MEHMPYEIKDQMIQCFGRCFHYKDHMESFLRSSGVSRDLANKYRDEMKFVWARKLLNDLEETENGRLLQRRILTELCKLRNVPPEIPDREAGLEALRKLKHLAVQHQIEFEDKKAESKSRENSSKARAKIMEERNAKLTDLRKRFSQGLTSENRQDAGFDLEDILSELFALFEIDYKKSYRTSTQQIDGHFKFEGFNYLVEAKWRKDQPNEAEIGGFKRKVDTKLDATRGLFLSVSGFRTAVIEEFDSNGTNIILMSGEDLVHIFEGRVSLRDALQIKIDNAAQYGKVYTRIY
jgi:hypothetical protein